MTSSTRLLVFSDDWGRHPSSCQHLIRQLLPKYRVTWVNTIGMRPPRLDRQTLSRGLEKLRHWVARRETSISVGHPNLEVISPRMWPWFSSPHDRWLNRRLLASALNQHLAASTSSSKHAQRTVAITTIPIVADLVGHLPVERWVYYCVDDFSVWPGLDQRTMASMEYDLVQRVDSILAVSETLQDRLVEMGRDSSLLTHGVDPDFWTAETQATLPNGFGDLASPLVVFWGVIDQRMDVTFLRTLSQSMPQGTILLVGPQQAPDAELARLPRVVVSRPVRWDDLPALAQRADCLVMPYQDIEVTRAMQPLKLKEYLATGRPVVVRDLPAVRPWSDACDLASTAEDFASLVQQRIQGGTPSTQQEARRRLQQESWSAKARDLEAHWHELAHPNPDADADTSDRTEVGVPR